MDAAFFRKAKKVNRAVEYTDSEAVIPAVSGGTEIRVALPNRRPLTLEERQQAIQIRYSEIGALEDEIESERKTLLKLVKAYATDGKASDIVVHNLKIKDLMERRSKLAHPEKWIEEIPGLTLKDIFESKRDTRKIGYKTFQIKRRVEPITSLYVDLGDAAAKATLQAEQEAATIASSIAAAKAADATAKAIAATVTAGTDALAATAAATRGAIIGQKRTITLKKTASGPGAPAPRAPGA